MDGAPPALTVTLKPDIRKKIQDIMATYDAGSLEEALGIAVKVAWAQDHADGEDG